MGKMDYPKKVTPLALKHKQDGGFRDEAYFREGQECKTQEKAL